VRNAGRSMMKVIVARTKGSPTSGIPNRWCPIDGPRRDGEAPDDGEDSATHPEFV
jgi:hypothetical protein